MADQLEFPVLFVDTRPRDLSLFVMPGACYVAGSHLAVYGHETLPKFLSYPLVGERVPEIVNLRSVLESPESQADMADIVYQASVRMQPTWNGDCWFLETGAIVELESLLYRLYTKCFSRTPVNVSAYLVQALGEYGTLASLKAGDVVDMIVNLPAHVISDSEWSGLENDSDDFVSRGTAIAMQWLEDRDDEKRYTCGSSECLRRCRAELADEYNDIRRRLLLVGIEIDELPSD